MQPVQRDMRSCCPLQAQVDENLKKQAELMAVIDRETAAYKHAFGYTEWRSACEVGISPPTLPWRALDTPRSSSLPPWV